VLANQRTDLPVPQVCFDDVGGMRLAVEHLLELGHRRIAYYCPPKSHGEHYSNADRLETFREQMHQAGLGGGAVVASGVHADAYAADLVQTPAADRPTAIVAYNDFDAVMLMGLLHRAGLRVPDDLSLMGFNDDAQSRESIPRLTTVATPMVALVQRCVTLLIERIEQAKASPLGGDVSVTTLPESLIVRESTAASPGP
jgi:DNA-binding LacI/PurR family transcriptional regulator